MQVLPRQKSTVEQILPFLQLALSERERKETKKERRTERKEDIEFKEKQLDIQQQLADLAKNKAEADLITKAFALTKKRKRGIFGKKEIQAEDVLKNFQLLKSLQGVVSLEDKDLDEIAKIDDADLKEFISNAKERDKLRKTNPKIFRTLLAQSQAQGNLLDLTFETEATKEAAETRRGIVPPTASAEERIGERIGQIPTGAAQRVGLTPSNIIGGVGKLPSQALGVLGSGFNLLGGAQAPFTGQRAATIPPEVLDLLRRGELFQNPLQNIQQSGQFVGQQLKKIPTAISQIFNR